ncbi:Uncharacterised protein [Vibrio cholerae]|nr:Uncharacterised protein [Vibrio cholerae]
MWQRHPTQHTKKNNVNRKPSLPAECVKYVMTRPTESLTGCVKSSCSDNRVKGINRRTNVSSKIKARLQLMMRAFITILHPNTVCAL